MGLPEKDYFTLTELSIRWECDTELLLNYIKTDKLRLSILAENYDAWVEEAGEPTNISGLFYVDAWTNLDISCDDETCSFKIDGSHLFDNRDRNNWSYLISHRYRLSAWSYEELFETLFFISKQERDWFENKYNLQSDTNNIDNCSVYTTPLLDVLYSVINEFWLPNSPQGPQKKEVIVRWILDHYGEMTEVSKNIAEQIDTITRHPDHKVRSKKKF